jgi:hypothetical protein
MRFLALFRFFLLSILLPIFLGACASVGAYRSPGPYHGGPLLGSGTYLQDVSIEPKGGKGFRFQGIFQRRATGVMISGLSPLGPTVFRIKDSLSAQSEPQVEIFVDEMQPHRERFVHFYKGLRPLLLLEDKPALANDFVKERYPDRRPRTLSAHPELELVVEEYDWEGHAFRLLMKAPTFTARITLREYTREGE